MDMDGIYLCLDVGGTEIKAAPIDGSGTVLQPVRHFPSRAKEPADVLLAHFIRIFEAIRQEGRTVSGLRLAFPGPFDYAKGICLLRGLDKYDALYGVDLRRAFSRGSGIAPEDILFTNDASAFALGEMGFGRARGAGRALFVCIGTGCGSAFGLNGRLAPDGTPGVPDGGYLYHAPYLDGCIDDYLSRRGLMALSRELLGESLDGKSLALRVQRGDERARQCFRAFGERIRDALLPYLAGFRPELLCLGGQITGSVPLFLEPLETGCRSYGIRLYTAKDTSASILRGSSLIQPSPLLI